jgi:hypothetical protein
VDITFDSMDDFAPAAVARRVGALAALLAARQQLVNLVSYMDGKSGAEDLISKVLRDQAAGVIPEQPRLERGGTFVPMTTSRVEELKSEQEHTQRDLYEGVVIGGEDFSRLLEKEFRPKTYDAMLALEESVRTLAREALAHQDLLHADAAKSIDDIVTALDRKLSRQLNMIMHNEEFQNLESAWRGLHYLVNNTETDEMLKIRFMNISKDRARQNAASLQGTRLGSEPAVQADQRGGVRPIRG